MVVGVRERGWGSGCVRSGCNRVHLECGQRWILPGDVCGVEWLLEARSWCGVVLWREE